MKKHLNKLEKLEQRVNVTAASDNIVTTYHLTLTPTRAAAKATKYRTALNDLPITRHWRNILIQTPRKAEH